MINQIGFLSSNPTEEWVFEALRPALIETLLKNNAGKDNIDISKGKSYSTVSYLRMDPYDTKKKPSKQLAFRICCRNDRYYFGLSAKLSSYFTPAITGNLISEEKTDGFYNFTFNPTVEGIQCFSALLCTALESAIDSTPKEFDCCSRYAECSDAAMCLNPSPGMAVSCGYRKIMKSGHIYYGMNRNV